MAWALQFDGVNDYIATDSGNGASSALMPTDKYSVKVRLKRLSSSFGYILINSWYGFYVSIRRADGAPAVSPGGSSHVVAIPDDGEFHNLEVIWDNTTSTVTIFVDAVQIDQFTGVNVAFSSHNSGTGSLHRILLGRYQHTSGQWLHAQVESAEVEDLIGGNKFSFSATASDHSNTGLQPVLIDTIGGNDATGVNMPTDGSAWVDLGGNTGTEQTITAVVTEQKTESELVLINQFNAINAIICEQVSQSQITNLIQNNQISTIVAEQKTEHSLTAIAKINSIASLVCEQLTQSAVIDNTENQVIYAAHAQQLTQALIVNVTTDAAQDINVVVTEQKTQSQAISVDEAQQLQAVISEQLTQTLNSGIEQSLTLNAITTEQLTEAVTVTIDESSGIFVSVVQTEQLTQAVNENVDVTALIGAVITEQLTQCSTEKIHVDINVSAIVAEQLTQTELIAIIQGDIAAALNIDIDQITLEILTPKYTIEMLTPIYTIEHLH